MLAAALPSDLSASHDLLQVLLNVALPGIILFRPVYAADESGRIIDLAYVHLNPAAQQMLCLPAQPRETFLTLYPNARETGIFAFYRDTFLAGQPGEYAINYPFDGLNNFFLLSARRSGELLVVGFTDTAAQERSQVEQALRESQAREQAARAEAEYQRGELERVLEQAPVAIAVFRGPTYTIELANATIARLWDRTREQLLGKGVYEALPETAGLGFEELMDGVMATGVPYAAHAMESRHRRRGRLDTLYWDFVYVPMYAADGRINGVMVVATDTTAQVRARHEVEELNQELEARVVARTQELTEANLQLTRTNVDLDTFIYTASHDLKAPIANIEGILLALRDQLPAAVQQEETVATLLDMLQRTVGRFQLTIAQLTDLSKLQRAHGAPAEPVQLAQVVEEVCLDLAPLIAAADAALTVEVAPALAVSFSPVNLRSVVYNLLSNAVKYRSPDRPARVRVRAAQVAQAVVLTVQDNGLGMSPGQQRQLFGLFQRLHAHVEGTGVGLYIVKRLVENGGGTIAVQSQPEVGTTFTVTLPATGD